MVPNVAYGGGNYVCNVGTGMSSSGAYTGDYVTGDGVFLLNNPLRFANITDGLSDTMAMSEALLGDGQGPLTGSAPNNVNREALLLSGSTLTTPQSCGGGATGGAFWSGAYNGNAWINGGYWATDYNAYNTPNSPNCDCLNTANNYGLKAARSMHVNGVNVLFCDGSVHFVNNSVSLATWRCWPRGPARTSPATITDPGVRRQLRRPLMTRILVLTAAAAALVGGALGWFVLSSVGTGAGPADPAHPPARADRSPTAEVARRFALSAADVPLDRETPAVAADAKGRIVVAWAARTGDLEHTLFLARSDDGGATFAAPTAFRKVAIYRYEATRKGQDVTYSTSVAPRLAAAGDAVYLGWTEAVGGGPRVVFYVARSTDGGRSFSEPAAAQDAEGQRPGFIGLSAGPDGAAACAWLDHRQGAQLPFFSLSAPDGSKFRPAALVYPGPSGGSVCPCCDAAVARAEDGAAFVAFRNDVSDDRDVYVARSAGSSSDFGPSVAVGPDHWHFEGCPHDGPAWSSPAAGCTSSGWMATPAGAASTTPLQRSPNSGSRRAS